MSRSKDLQLLNDILESIGKITLYVEGLNFEDFEADIKTQDAVIRNFEIIGEAARKISSKLKTSNPSIPWIEMYSLRNRVIHDYFNVDLQILWDIIKYQLSSNRKDIIDLISQLKNS